MPSPFSADSRSLEQLLSNLAVYRVPDYQRTYSWTTKEAGQLLDDVMLACGETADVSDPDQGYFMGAVLLMQSPPEPMAGDSGVVIQPFDIVDGQQRLVTLSILLAVIRDLAADRGMSPGIVARHLIEVTKATSSSRYRIQPRGAEGKFLETFVQQPGASLEMPDEENFGDGESRILAVREHFAEALLEVEDAALEKLARFLSSACHFAVVTTRTIDRAHRIFSVLNERGRPLARNDILKAQILGGLNPADRQAASQRWTAMERTLDASFEELFSHIRALGTSSRGTIIDGIGSVIEQSGGPLLFFNDVLEPYAGIFAAIRDPAKRAASVSPAVATYVSYLSWLGSAEWVPALMLHWRQVNGDPAQLESFLARYERLGFGLRLLGIGADKRHTRYGALLGRLRNGASLDDPESPMEFSREEQRNILYNLRGIHARSQLTCKLLLLRLNDEIAGAPQDLDPANYTVEHVLPQKPGRNSQWREWFPLADDRESATQSLGNLVLVTREQNDRARNMELAKKLEVYFGRDAVVPHLTRELQHVTEWRQPQILEREQRLRALIHRLWRFDTGKPSGADDAATTAAPPSRRRRSRAVGV